MWRLFNLFISQRETEIIECCWKNTHVHTALDSPLKKSQDGKDTEMVSLFLFRYFLSCLFLPSFHFLTFLLRKREKRDYLLLSSTPFFYTTWPKVCGHLLVEHLIPKSETLNMELLHPLLLITASTLLGRLSATCWKIAAGTCFHSATRALVRLGTDFGWLGLARSLRSHSSQRSSMGLKCSCGVEVFLCWSCFQRQFGTR